jgi:ankyrin repeat protein
MTEMPPTSSQWFGYLICGNLSAIQQSVESGFDYHTTDSWGCTALHWAALNGHFEIMTYLLSIGACDIIDDKKIDGQTALHLAVHDERYDIAKCLIRAGADSTIPNKTGLSAYDMALRKKNSLMASLFKTGDFARTLTFFASDWIARHRVSLSPQT